MSSTVALSEQQNEEWYQYLVRKIHAAAQPRQTFIEASGPAWDAADTWVMSDVEIRGGFRWTCDVLGLDYEVVRKAVVMRRAGKGKPISLEELL